MTRCAQKRLLLLVLLAFVSLHLPFLSATWFIADDAQELAYVRGLDSWWMLFGCDAFGLFRPVKNLLFLSLSQMTLYCGMIPCRVFALAIAIGSFFAVYALMKRVFGDGCKALLAASIWLFAPTMASQIVWLSCLNIQVMVAFAALSIIAHDSRQAVLSAIFVFLACVSYECAVAVGPMIVAFDFFIRPERFADRLWWRRYALVIGVILCFLLLRGAVGAVSSVNGSFANVTHGEICAASAYFSCQHFLTWLWPFGQFAVFGGYVGGSVSGVVLVICWCVLLSLGAFALLVRRRLPSVGLGIILILVGFLPVSNVTGAGNGPYGDYYLALSSIGFAIAGVALTERYFVAIFAFLLLRMLFVPELVNWVALWTDGDKGLVAAVENHPNYIGNQVMLAQRFSDLGAPEIALEHASAVEKLVGPDSGQMGPLHLIRALYELNVAKNATNALEFIRRSRKCSDFGGALVDRSYYIGCVYDDLLNDPESAEREYRASLRRKWTVDSVPAADRLARLLALKGNADEAVSLWERALRMQPNNGAIRHNLAVVRSRQKGKAPCD